VVPGADDERGIVNKVGEGEGMMEGEGEEVSAAKSEGGERYEDEEWGGGGRRRGQ